MNRVLSCYMSILTSCYVLLSFNNIVLIHVKCLVIEILQVQFVHLSLIFFFGLKTKLETWLERNETWQVCTALLRMFWPPSLRASLTWLKIMNNWLNCDNYIINKSKLCQKSKSNRNGSNTLNLVKQKFLIQMIFRNAGISITWSCPWFSLKNNKSLSSVQRWSRRCRRRPCCGCERRAGWWRWRSSAPCWSLTSSSLYRRWSSWWSRRRGWRKRWAWTCSLTPHNLIKAEKLGLIIWQTVSFLFPPLYQVKELRVQLEQASGKRVLAQNELKNWTMEAERLKGSEKQLKQEINAALENKRSVEFQLAQLTKYVAFSLLRSKGSWMHTGCECISHYLIYYCLNKRLTNTNCLVSKQVANDHHLI